MENKGNKGIEKKCRRLADGMTVTALGLIAGVFSLALVGTIKTVKYNHSLPTIEEKQKIEIIDSNYNQKIEIINSNYKIKYDSLNVAHKKAIDSLQNDYLERRSKIFYNLITD